MMKIFFYLFASLVVLTPACDSNKDNNDFPHVNCEDYWSQVPFENFCGLARANFDYSGGIQDICNADQNDSYTFDDLVSIRVYNHFDTDGAMEEYLNEEDFYSGNPGFTKLANVGDDAFGVIETAFGELDGATIRVVKGTYTVDLFVNGNASTSANNCFDETSVIEFARALVGPLE